MATKKYQIVGDKKNLYLASRDIRFVNGRFETDVESEQQFIEEHPFFGPRITLATGEVARKPTVEVPVPKPRHLSDDDVAKRSISMIPKKAEEPKMPSPPKRSALNSMKKSDLVRVANGWKIPNDGTRKVLMARLVDHFTPLWAAEAKKK